VVKFEVSSATITCQNVSNCGANLGYTYGTPQIRRFHNGMWGAVFGNGYGSASGDAGIFVMVLNPGSGSGPPTPQFYYLSTGTAGSNGIAYVTTADLDGDHITDFVYAGDLQGNLWRFDLSSACPTGSCSTGPAGPWAVTSGGPLFKATITNGHTTVNQPITGAVIVAGAAVTTTATPQVIVGFGTGQRNQFTNTSAATYISGTQSIYGVWDWNFSAWNALPQQGATYASLTASQERTASGVTGALGPSNLQAQSFTISGGNIVASNTAFTYATNCTGSGGCAGKFGWLANLLSTNGDTSTGTSTGAPITEQVVAPVSLFESAMIFNSVVPASPNILSCETPQTDTGITYALNVLTGGTFNFGTSGSPNLESAFVNYKDTAVVGLATNETGAGSVLSSAENTNYVMGQLIAPTSTQPGRMDQINLPNNITSNRQTWVQLR
jgi:type IV pilus assembly protein PilY1